MVHGHAALELEKHPKVAEFGRNWKRLWAIVPKVSETYLWNVSNETL